VLTVPAQSGPPLRPAPSSQPTPGQKKDDDVDFSSRQDDARTRLMLKAEKKAYQEHLARAKEASDLAAELQKTYDTARVFNAADFKKLERLEKLVRRIRNEVGGSQTDADPKDLPKTIDEGVTVLAKSTKDLHKEVEQTPRRIVSASIIEQANKLIALIQHLRGDRD
jgi:archaellum component FlaC